MQIDDLIGKDCKFSDFKEFAKGLDLNVENLGP